MTINTNRPAKAMIYCRTACTPASGEDAALLAQEAECRAYAAAHGLEVTDVFHDRGISGMRARRPGLDAIIQSLWQASGAHCILVDELAHLARDPDLYYAIQAECEQLGHSVIIADD